MHRAISQLPNSSQCNNLVLRLKHAVTVTEFTLLWRLNRDMKCIRKKRNKNGCCNRHSTHLTVSNNR